RQIVMIHETPKPVHRIALRHLLSESRVSSRGAPKRPTATSWQVDIGEVYSSPFGPHHGEHTMPTPAPFRRAPRAIRFRLERLDDRNLPSVARLLALGADAGGVPQVRLIDPATGQEQSSFLAYDSAFRGGVRVALGDVNA